MASRPNSFRETQPTVLTSLTNEHNGLPYNTNWTTSIPLSASSDQACVRANELHSVPHPLQGHHSLLGELLDHVAEIIWRVLQHMSALTLLMVYLYSMPIVFAVGKLQSWAGYVGVTSLYRPSIQEPATEYRTQCCDHIICQQAARVCQQLLKIILMPFRLAYSLYQLPELIERDMYIAERRAGSMTLSAKSDENSAESNSGSSTGVKKGIPIWVAAFSSLSHSVNLNSEPPANLMLRFDRSDQKDAPHVRHETDNLQQPGQDEIMSSCSSISKQSTSEAAHTTVATPCLERHPQGVLSTALPQLDDEDADEEKTPIQRDVSESSQRSSADAHIDLQGCNHQSDHEHKKRPTFERRQARSRLPRKALCETAAGTSTISTPGIRHSMHHRGDMTTPTKSKRSAKERF